MLTHSPEQIVRYRKPLVFLLCLAPLAFFVYRGVIGDISPNPVEEVTHLTGDWTLWMLLITLALTPLRRITGMAWLLRFRRMLGLFAFFYACLHLMTYLWLDQFFALGAIVEDVIQRPYITVGFAAFLLMVPLAVTSTKGMVRRLGKSWKTLHRAVYAIAVLGVLHFLWLAKADVSEPATYGLVLAILLLMRLPFDQLTDRFRRGARAVEASLNPFAIASELPPFRRLPSTNTPERQCSLRR